METELGSAFADILQIKNEAERESKLESAKMYMKVIADGGKEEIHYLKLKTLGVYPPFKLPVFNDLKGNEEFWQDMKKWASRQLGAPRVIPSQTEEKK